MKARTRELIEQGDKLFSKRRTLDGLWQVIAEQFCPIRADFTRTRPLGEEFASDLMTGRPVLAHRDLGNSLSSMLRPRGIPWFHARTGDENVNNDAAARSWLDNKSDVMRRIMYDQRSQFTRATKQGDHDFVAFGQTVIAVDINKDRNGLLYRNFHLRDLAWCENDELVIDVVHHNWMHDCRALLKKFPATCSDVVKRISEKEPYREIKCRRIILPADDYDMEKKPKNRDRFPFVAIMVDCENDTILEEVPVRRVPYVIPRWQTVAGSPYAHSPAAVVALPDARMLQQMTLTLLEAGQKAVDPPLKATQSAVIGGVNAYAGALTWVDSEYDERMGAALEPLYDTGKANLSWGQSREEKIEQLISEAFFLNVINLPEASPKGDKMTAYETQERVKEYIRRALPLFEPMEVEYNGGLCEMTWNLSMDLNAFGPLDDIPDNLKGRDVVWQFESPLQAANERVKSEAFTQSAQLLAQAAQIDPSVRADFDVSKAFRDALSGVARADWIVPVEQAAAAKQVEAQKQAAAEAANAMATGADVATRMGTAVQSAGNAAQSLQAAGVA